MIAHDHAKLRLIQVIDMVRHRSPAIFCTIDCDKPFAAKVRARFFALADETRADSTLQE